MTLTQKDYKALKQGVVADTAIGVGFFAGIESKIPDYALIEAIREMATNGWIGHQTSDGDIRNMLVTESIKAMNFQDFKDVAPYLFSYPREQRQEDLLVAPIEVSRSLFETLQAEADELFRLKRELAYQEQEELTIMDVIDQIEHQSIIQETGYSVVGISQDQSQFLILDNRSADQRDPYLGEEIFEGELLLNDYRSPYSNKAQIMDGLIEQSNQIATHIYQYYNDVYYQESGVLDGLEIVQNYYQEDQLDTKRLEGVKSTSSLWRLAQDSPSFQSDYETVMELLEDDGIRDYIRDYPDHFLDDKDQVELVQGMLAEDGKQLAIKEVTGYSQGEFWTLGAIYDTALFKAEEIDFYLEHEVGAFYKGSLTEAMIISKEQLESLGLEAAAQSAETFIVNEELLWGKNSLEVLTELLQLEGYESLEQVMDQEVVSQEKEETIEMER
ncbi:hypothetical protein [Streptococcus ovuberis]|uniref:Uncharacterized protein n=1 Tax=Streptococcus ovuberis TaxID=1936207 RepID=A0A7X6MXQ4_9STRE|nr:hypothetical protein [Streptococcus ovuberis]NKZ19688.1 hypothetical protein [Streptococcus ovuberis]